MQQQQMNINPLSILAAILFNYNKSEIIKIKPDDASPEVEVEALCLSIEQEGEAIVCAIAADKVLKYNMTPYDFKMRGDKGYFVISFEKQTPAPVLLTATGQKMQSESDVVQKLIERMR